MSEDKWIDGFMVLAIGIMITLLFVWRNDHNNEIRVDKLDKVSAQIVSINTNSMQSEDKSKVLQSCNLVLFKVIDPNINKYFEINTCNVSDRGFSIDASWMYNHKAGDTSIFTGLNKNRLFTIKADYVKELK